MSHCPFCNTHFRYEREKEIHRCFVGQVVSPSLSEDADVRNSLVAPSSSNQPECSNSNVHGLTDVRCRSIPPLTCSSTHASTLSVTMNGSQSATSEHSSPSMLQCSICRKFYATKASLSKHVRSIHEGERYLCLVPECRQEFRSSSARKTHLERSHAWTRRLRLSASSTRAARPFKCVACGASFTARRELTRHTNKAHRSVAPSNR